MRYLALLLAAPKTLPQPPSALSPASGPPPPWPGPSLERFAIPGFDHGHRALQHGGISAIPGQLDRVAPEVLHQLHIEAAQLQEREGLVPFAHGLELEAVEVLVVVVGQLLEDPASCHLEHGDSLAPGEHIEGVGLQGEASKE